MNTKLTQAAYEALIIPDQYGDIDLNPDGQKELLQSFSTYAQELDLPMTKQDSHRFFYENPMYSYGDAAFLFCMLRYVAPKKIIEIGSGFSSALMLDVNERYLNWSAECSFNDPDISRLQYLLRPEDMQKVQVHQRKLEDIPTEYFQTLEANDVLFIDTTHALHAGNEVCHCLFRVLPALRPGVIVHIHDIFYPFEYPINWINDNWNFAELYAVRAFLQYNSAFSILLFNQYLWYTQKAAVEELFPLFTVNPGGGLWLQKK